MPAGKKTWKVNQTAPISAPPCTLTNQVTHFRLFRPSLIQPAPFQLYDGQVRLVKEVLLCSACNILVFEDSSFLGP